jgi:hypothetical protein
VRACRPGQPPTSCHRKRSSSNPVPLGLTSAATTAWRPREHDGAHRSPAAAADAWPARVRRGLLDRHRGGTAEHVLEPAGRRGHQRRSHADRRGSSAAVARRPQASQDIGGARARAAWRKPEGRALPPRVAGAGTRRALRASAAVTTAVPVTNAITPTPRSQDRPPVAAAHPTGSTGAATSSTTAASTSPASGAHRRRLPVADRMDVEV